MSVEHKVANRIYYAFYLYLGTVKKTRGTMYCRKLTALPLGEKLTVEFNTDSIHVGNNGSTFSFFLGK